MNKDVLLKELEKFSDRENAKVFIGKVCYQRTDEISGSLVNNDFLKNENKKPFSLDNDEDAIKLMLLKRNAFQHESELRILIVPKEKKQGTDKGLKFDYRCKPSELVSQIMVPRSFFKDLTIGYWRSLGFEDVCTSHLYDMGIREFKYID